MPKPYTPSGTAPALSRRHFIKYSTVTATVLGIAPSFLRGQNLNERINVACIGVGGKGSGDTESAFALGGNIVGLCDIDSGTLNGKHKSLQTRATKDNRTYDAKLYKDFRKMFDELGSSIDAVTVSTPDHVHGLAALTAMKMGKHVYCQKPLTQTVWEAREMRRLATQKKLATQMGNQGSADDGLRRGVEVIQAGVIGHPKELHVWSNRPIWPQGIDRPTGEDPVPDTIDWDLWIGPAQMRPFKKGVYHAPGATGPWRGWYDFGTGALGDMACHTVNMPFRALKLGYPTVVEAEVASRVPSETFPLTTRIRFEFPERDGLPPLKFWWYDGNPKSTDKMFEKPGFVSPLRPPADLTKEIISSRKSLPGSGCLVIGEKGKLFSPSDYGSEFSILLNDEKEYKNYKDHEACKDVPKTIPRSPGHDKEWFEMMKGGPPAYSNFDIAAYLTEIILLGCVALRVGVGQRLDWDGPNMRAKNNSDAERFVKRVNRPGWGLS